MFHTGLLLLTGSLRCIIESIGNYLNHANKTVAKRLYIKLEPEFNKPFPKSNSKSTNHLSKSIPLIYLKASELCDNLDIRVLSHRMRRGFKTSDIEIILTDSMEDNQNIINYINQHFDDNCQNIVKLRNETVTNPVEIENETSNYLEFSDYRSVCMGGTFDRLHNGHKVLLSEAVMRTTERLFVGITDGKMLERKVLWELIQPTEKRIEKVREFLVDIDPSIHYEVAPIVDPFGPTITNPDIDCIVVSKETKLGGERVNQERVKKGMKELAMHVVELVENVIDGNAEEKISSTSVRKKLLGTLLQKPQSSPDAGKSFRIHLIGPPASGKSCISKLLISLGAEVICCDEVIINLLTKEMTCDRSIQTFCEEENIYCNNSLNYKKLTKVLLKNVDKRQWFISRISNSIKAIIEEKFQHYEEKGAGVILIKSSVLLNLDWDSTTHQVWTTILSFRENVRKLQECYELTEAEAENILSSVPSNKENVCAANIVFSNQWTPDFTKKQVERAWSYLQEKNVT